MLILGVLVIKGLYFFRHNISPNICYIINSIDLTSSNLRALLIFYIISTLQFQTIEIYSFLATILTFYKPTKTRPTPYM